MQHQGLNNQRHVAVLKAQGYGNKNRLLLCADCSFFGHRIVICLNAVDRENDTQYGRAEQGKRHDYTHRLYTRLCTRSCTRLHTERHEKQSPSKHSRRPPGIFLALYITKSTSLFGLASLNFPPVTGLALSRSYEPGPGVRAALHRTGIDDFKTSLSLQVHSTCGSKTACMAGTREYT